MSRREQVRPDERLPAQAAMGYVLVESEYAHVAAALDQTQQGSVDHDGRPGRVNEGNQPCSPPTAARPSNATVQRIPPLMALYVHVRVPHPQVKPAPPA